MHNNNSPYRTAFPISPELYTSVTDIVDEIRNEGKTADNLKRLTNIIIELTDTGLEYFFVHSLEKAGTGGLQIGTVKLALTTARRAIGAVARKILKNMSESQVLTIVDFIESLLLEVEEA